MPYFILILFTLSSCMTANNEAKKIYQFNSNSEKKDWRIVNDGVMGGLSKGKFEINSSSNGLFSGSVSLENNGGFTMIQHELQKPIKVKNATKLKLELKGDGKNYQFRVKSKLNEYYSYVKYFETKGEWETVDIPLSDLEASFRGGKLDMPSFDQKEIAQIAFLISNKKAETFELEIKSISLE